jgi:hypothetical protein
VLYTIAYALLIASALFCIGCCCNRLAKLVLILYAAYAISLVATDWIKLPISGSITNVEFYIAVIGAILIDSELQPSPDTQAKQLSEKPAKQAEKPKQQETPNIADDATAEKQKEKVNAQAASKKRNRKGKKAD